TNTTAGSDGIVDENSAIGSTVGITANTVDGDDGQTVAYTLSGADAALFSIDADGIVTTAAILDHEVASQRSFAVTATSSDGSTATRDFTVTVTDLADEDLSPITDTDTTAGSDGIIDENSAIGSNVGITANTVDGDDGQTIAYTLSGSDAALFSIDADGIVTTAAILDHEAASQRNFTVTATSSDGSTATRDFTVTVTDLADEDLSPITDTDTTAGSDGIIDENSAIGSNVGITANTVDGDDGQTIAYTLSGSDAALFSIDADGIVTTAAILDHEAADQRSFTVTATSSDGSTATRDFTVSVTDLPDEDLSPITDTDTTAGSDGIIDENSAIGSTVGITANTIDADAGQTVSYALSGTDAALFSIDANGVVTTAAALDHEAASQRSFTVTATSSDGSTATRDFTVSVTDLPDEDLSPITDTDTTAGSDGIIDENSAIGSTVGITANTIDADAGQTVSYALSGTDAALFSIDANGVVTTAAALDHEAALQRNFTVTATSSDGSTATRDFTVTVTDLADEDLSPITDTNATAGSDGIINENSDIGSIVGITANSVDGDAGQTVSYELTGTDAALFDIDANGIVTTAAVLDHEAASQRNFTVTATSTDGSAANHSFTVVVADLNEEPVFTTSAKLPDAIEDVLYTTTISTFDADTNDSVTFNNAVIPAWLSLIDNGDGTATFSG
ncbi:beta strand repeat-containing protein, partial [Maritalea sp.]|uniref:beta strand repeat-containing protein n=1 Tax=Maritalea sp. TaxID=2003361 RepID=UPI003EF1EC44